MSLLPTFYAFFDKNVNRYYYYNYETKENLWNYPTKAIVLNPETNEFFENPMMREISTQQGTILQNDNENKDESNQKTSSQQELNEIKEKDEMKENEEIHDFPIYFNKKESKEAEDIYTRKHIKTRARHHTMSFKSPDFYFNEFRSNDSRLLTLTDDDLPPLVLEIDESILNFDPSKQEQDNKSEIPKRPSFSYIQGIELFKQMNTNLSLCDPQIFESLQTEDDSNSSKNQNNNSIIIETFNQAPNLINKDNKNDIKQNKEGDNQNDGSDSILKANSELKEEDFTTILQIYKTGVEIHQEEEDNDKIKFIPPQTNEKQPYLPTDVGNGAKSYTLDKYAVKNFKPYSKGKWNKQTVPLEELVSFSNDPIPSPLLKCLPDNLQKPAVKMFKLILDYSQKGNMQAPVEIVEIVNQDKQLIDEVYFQLMKQTSGTPDTNILIRTWHIFLIIATIFPSSRGCEIWIKSHIARNMSNDCNDVKIYARFTYIRFSSRCTIGTIMEKITPEYIMEIPTHPFSSSTVFGCSLYEIMWGQRRTVPTCPIPYFLVQMVQMLIKKGCFSKEGIFRKPGNIKKVNEMATNANSGMEVLSGAALDDIASLMKKWFRDMNDYIVPNNLAHFMNVALQEGKTIAFAAALPPVNSITLAYLIGFLQELAKYEGTTKMGPENLAMCFSPNIVSPEFASKTLSAGPGQSFLLYLIEHWDVSLIYPLKL